MKFLITPKIHPLESLTGFLIRICIENGYPSLNSIRNRLFTSTIYQAQSNLFRDSDIHLISEFCGKNYDNLKKHGLDYWNKKLVNKSLDKYVLKNKVKYCPICIKENNYHQFKWGYNFVCICLTHQCQLIDTCQQCNTRISMEALYSNRCTKCNAIFSDVKSNCIDHISNIYVSQQVLQQIFTRNSILLNDTVDINIKDFLMLAESSFHILEGLKSFTGDSEFIRVFNKKNVNYNNDIYLTMYSNLWWMYQDFPNNFYRILEKYLSKKRSQRFIQKEQFEKILDNFQWLKEAYIQFWINQLDKGKIRSDFSLFNREKNILEMQTMIGLEEARKVSGISRERLLELIASGLLVADSNGDKVLISRTSLIEYRTEMNSYIGKNTAAKLLGIQKNGLQGIIDSGLLKQFDTLYYCYKVLLKSEVEDLRIKCCGEIVKVIPKGMLSFHEVLIKYSVTGLSISDIVKFIFEKKLNTLSLSVDGYMKDCFINRNELEKCIDDLKRLRIETEGYYLTEVIQILKIGEKKAHKLMEAGILVPEKIITWKDGRKRYLFSREKVAGLKLME